MRHQYEIDCAKERFIISLRNYLNFLGDKFDSCPDDKTRLSLNYEMNLVSFMIDDLYDNSWFGEHFLGGFNDRERKANNKSLPL